MTSSKKILRTILLAIVAAIVIFFIYKKVADGGTKEPAGPAAGRGGSGGGGNRPLLADAYVVKTTRLDETIDASGTLQSNEEVEVKPEISGRIVGLYFKEGVNVTKGALLVKIYDDDLKAQLQKLQLQQQLAKTTLERQENLLKINGISQQDVDVTADGIRAHQSERPQHQQHHENRPEHGQLL